jgi:hypothetical protein
MTLYAAEINVVVVRKLWPRSLLGPPEAPADQETLAALAKVEERHEVEQVDVHFLNGESDGGTPGVPASPPEVPASPPEVPASPPEVPASGPRVSASAPSRKTPS